MFLQRIELQGFKSFAQKTILEFPAPGRGCLISPNVSAQAKQLPKGICGTTAIVGPNGSGKSNVVDAVRWVLGEQSLKLLRGKKATDVIFSGSSTKSRASMAEVSLYLNNEDKSAPVDYSEVVITRKLYQDGESEYRLNKAEARLFDIVMLLAKANFGQNTYSIIGQGMVDKIVNYSAAERKEFFDEATGVKQFQIKRDRSVNKLKKSRENLLQVEGLLTELRPHLSSLTRQVNRLRKRQAVETELKELQIKYYGRLWLDLDGRYQELVVSFTGQEKAKIKLEAEINERQEALEQFGQEKSRAEEFNRLKNDYDQKIAERDSLLQQLAAVRGKLDVEYLKLGKSDLTWLENRRTSLLGQIADLASQWSGLDGQISRYQKILAAKAGEQEKVLAEFQDLEAKLVALQKELSSELGVSEKEIRAIVSRLHALHQDFFQKLKTTHDLESLAKLKAEAEVIFDEVNAFYQRLSRDERKGQSDEMAETQRKLSEFLKSKDLLVNEINDIRIKLEVAISQRHSLKAQKEELEAELKKAESELKKNQLAPKDQSEATRQLKLEKDGLEKDAQAVDLILAAAKKKIDEFNEAEENKKRRIFAVQQEIHERQMALNSVVSRLNEVKVALAKIETKKEDVFASMRADLGADYRPRIDKNLQEVEVAGLADKIFKLKKQLELIGGTDPEAEKEYQAVKTRHDFLSQQSEDLAKAIKDLEKIVAELDRMIKAQFELEFKKINHDFSRFFKKLFDGGLAKLILVQKLEEQTEAEAAREEVAAKGDFLPRPDPLHQSFSEAMGEQILPSVKPEGAGEAAAEREKKIVHPEDKSFLANMGIDIEVSPPGKKIKNISSLSGGEKTMTALALICSIISNNPSPFILFDEVDAALDEANSAKFSGIVEELSHKTQFIVITHNRAIMARADVLYGVTMQGDGISRLISLRLDEAEKMTK